MREEFDMELAMESVYGMDEDLYAGYNEYLDGSDLDNLNRDEADDYRDEGYDDYDPSDDADMYGGWDEFDEYMGGE